MGSTYTFTLEWVQEVPAHLAIISRRAGRVVHAPHVIRRVLENDAEGRGEKNKRFTGFNLQNTL